ncbi:protein SGT1 homolog [Danio rerio]|uniref:Protein SGT1 homolog n=2 Tax=Danio rerio TaxID=7955 RepID=Q5U3E4_DANRE|nr:protein SGT1 homolog [Danio rerio]AAH85582.1 Zgc:103668 [Danio rerio]AAI52152.1 Zgc:103668 [Danio rerio]AAI64350.1 Zgc:103668 protein [Danio rerio]|eukprot:NP_001007362.1 protein SGT1 homolog [Danio rerio]
MATCGRYSDSFIDEDPRRALEELNEALGEKADNAEWLCQRAYAYILLKEYTKAIDDAKKAQDLQPGLALPFLRIGIAEYHLHNFVAAHQALTAGRDLDSSVEEFQTWMQHCETEMATHIPNKTSDLQTTTHVKHDWYQTESQVAVTIMVKNAKKEGVIVSFGERELTAVVKLPSGEDYCLKVHLLHPIVPQQSTYKILSTKIEIKMKKTEAIQWEKLQGEETLSNVKHFTASQYPSSSHYTRNWDKLVGEIKEEEKKENLEGDAALNKLFQQIYSDGSDDVRRAMNKSFMESGGTVLSTNWIDVGKRKVEMNPPDDVEWKKY